MAAPGILSLLLISALPGGHPFRDCTHDSRVFHERRNYRIFLPADYDTSNQRYPVIYYFHGHSDRYTLEHYDQGLDTVPRIAAFVAGHNVIVVAPDGYVARDYTGFYGGAPYDVRRDGGEFDYGEYFLELARHIDATYRTLASRRYRATSGLSMGGFMSLYLSARFPGLVGSASAFNPGPEFYAGEKGRRSLWRTKDHVRNHEHSMVRLIRASGDYISQYHEETRAVYARTPEVDFEFRQDEYHRHWATSIEETFAFHMRAFASPALDTAPEEWSYTSAQRKFDIRGMSVDADVAGPALIELERVRQGLLEIRSRRWAPDGPAADCHSIRVSTASLYRAGAAYRLFDYALATGQTASGAVTADAAGRLHFAVDCGGHIISFDGEGTGGQPPVTLPLSAAGVWRVRPGQVLAVPLRVYNPRSAPLEIRAELTSRYPTVEILQGKAAWKAVPGGGSAAATPPFTARFTSGDGEWAHARLDLKLIYDGWREASQPLDVLIAPDPLPVPAEIAILDGCSRTFPVFRQKGNQGGGAAMPRTVTEGRGNGNGILEPGEQATIWVRLPQGLDPFDKNNWRRAKVYADSPWLTEIADIQEDKEREWTGAQNRTSLVALASTVPPATAIPLVLDCESWSFQYTPDVRYGKELLYQAFQLHRHHLFQWIWKAGENNITRPRRNT